MLSAKLLDGRLKFRHLTLLTAIDDHGSLVAAANALHVTQPVMTRGLQEVEAILGVPLFTRGPRGVVPTVFGENFVRHARSIIAQVRQAGGQIDLLVRADIGRVRVGTHAAGSNVLLPRALTSLKRDHPKLVVEVQEATPDALYQALLAGDVDMVVSRLRSAPPSGLRQELLYTEPILLVARVDHPVHRLKKPTLERLAAYPWILPIEQTSLRAELEESFIVEQVPLPDNRIECTSMLIVRELVASTDMVAAVPELIAQQDARLKPIDTRLRATRQSVGVTTVADVPPVPAAEMLVSHLRSVAQQL